MSIGRLLTLFALGWILVSGTACERQDVAAQGRTATSGHWVKATGRITASKIRHSQGYAGGGSFYCNSFIDIEYQFSIDNETFIGKDTADSVRCGNERQVDKMRANYPLGASILVYYNPEMPLISYLDPVGDKHDRIFGVFIFFLFAVIFILITATTIVILNGALHKYRKLKHKLLRFLRYF